MDIISFNEASTANGRIESFIENPDSTSGIVTVPSTIASGETITIPAGRVAILPNVQVDGVLNVEGEVFIPSGATFGDLENKIALKASLLSPDFTGNPTAPTQTAGDNSTKLATTAYVDGKMVLGTAVTASGTAIDFTNIPSWVKRVTIVLDSISTNNLPNFLIQLGGGGGIENSGYTSSASTVYTSLATLTSTIGFNLIGYLSAYNSASLLSSLVTIDKLDQNIWCCSHTTAVNTPVTNSGGGRKQLSSTLDRIRITTVNGTDIFDAGQINIMYEG